MQIKTPGGPQWLTVPVKKTGRPQLIKDAVLDDGQPWRDKHRKFLRQSLAGSPFLEDAMAVVDRVYTNPTASLAEFNRLGVEAVADYFDLRPRFVVSSTIGSPAASSEKLLDVVGALHGTTYITGHGALNYLNHELFEGRGIRVEYVDYQKVPYSQLHGEFDALRLQLGPDRQPRAAGWRGAALDPSTGKASSDRHESNRAVPRRGRRQRRPLAGGRRPPGVSRMWIRAIAIHAGRRPSLPAIDLPRRIG